MTDPRRTGTEGSKTRALLLDATQRIMREQGYAAVTSRSVANEAGVTPSLVHYYFPSLDDLFLALFRRGAEKNLVRHASVLTSPEPLHALWELSIEPADAVLLTEFMALANHRKNIRNEIAEYALRFRRLEAALLESRRGDAGPEDEDGAQPPLTAVLVVLACLSRGLVMEQELGVTLGHPETFALVERLLRKFDRTGAA